MRPALPCLLAAMLLSGACSQGGDDGGAGAAPDQPATSDSIPVPPECLPRSSTVPRRTEPGQGTAYLIDAEVATEGCTDVVAFEFDTGNDQLPPGYRAQYGGGPFLDFTSLTEIEVDGNAHLVIQFLQGAVVSGTTAQGSDEAPAEPTYGGRESIDPSGMNHLDEARLVIGPPEAIQWVIGLDGERPFIVDSTANPPRVLVKIG